MTFMVTHDKFISLSVLRYVTSESSLKEDQDPHNPDKQAMEKEKDLLDKYKVELIGID